MHANSMQKRSRVRNPFASFLNPGMYGFELVCTGMLFPQSRLPASVEFINKASMCVLVCTKMYHDVRVHAGMYLYELGCTDLYL